MQEESRGGTEHSLCPEEMHRNNIWFIINWREWPPVAGAGACSQLHVGNKGAWKLDSRHQQVQVGND